MDMAPWRPLRSPPRDIPYRAVQSYLHIARRRGVSLATLLEGTDVRPADLEAWKCRLTWDEHCLLIERIRDLVGGAEELAADAQRVPMVSLFGPLTTVSQLAASPSLLFQLAARLGLPRLFPATTATYVPTSTCSGTFCLHIRAPYPPSESFFAYIAGTLRALPRQIGLPDAKLQWHSRERSATYYIDHSASRTVWARLSYCVGFLFDVDGAFEAHRATEQALVERTRELDKQGERLRFAYAEAERTQALEKALLRNVSHELRTPMNGIIGNLEHLWTSLPDGELRQAATDAMAASERMMKLVDNLIHLQVETIETKEAPIVIRPFMSRLLADFEQPAADRSNVLRLEIDDELPEELVGDPCLVSGALAPLVDNAVRFTAEGTIVVSVRFGEGASRPGHRLERVVHFEVRDDGPGMDSETMQRAFDPFNQADSSLRRQYEGLGLGIPVAKRLVEAVGARLQVASAPGEGTRFWFTLPFRGPREPAPSPRATAAPSPSPPPRASDHPTVLIVEDNRTNTALLKRMCMGEGLEVVCAEDGLEALEILSRPHAIDLILMDCQMPRLDGYEATRRIRNMEPPNSTLPIVAVTAHALDEDRERCFSVGMDDFVAKPVRSAVLKEKLASFLSRAVSVRRDLSAEI